LRQSVQEVSLFTFLFWDCVSLKMEALSSSEMALPFHQMTRRNIREEPNLQRRCENLKSPFSFNDDMYMFVWKPRSRRQLRVMSYAHRRYSSVSSVRKHLTVQMCTAVQLKLQRFAFRTFRIEISCWASILPGISWFYLVLPGKLQESVTIGPRLLPSVSFPMRWKSLGTRSGV